MGQHNFDTAPAASVQQSLPSKRELLTGRAATNHPTAAQRLNHQLWKNVRATPGGHRKKYVYCRYTVAEPGRTERVRSAYLRASVVCTYPTHLSFETFSVAESEFENRITATVGTVCWVVGGLFSALVFADRWTSLSLRFPDLWYTSRNFHLLICVGLYVAGWLALRNRGESDQTTPPPMFDSLTLYTRSDCELCDKARDILRGFGDRLPAIRIVDIDSDPELQTLHRDWIPVVEIDGRVYFRGVVNATLLERMIRAREDRQRSAPHNSDATGQIEA